MARPLTVTDVLGRLQTWLDPAFLHSGSARAQSGAAPPGHFDPKDKAPSKYTLEVLKEARSALPFADQRDFEEQKKEFIAPMPDSQIKADDGHVAWDMERFQFLLKKSEFDSVHPSLNRISVLNMNYGLYEVIPGIYQVRGFDLSDISFVRGRTGWIVDPLTAAETARAALSLFQRHVGKGLPITAVIYSHSHGDHWGGVRAVVDEADVRAGKVAIIAPRDFMQHTISENVYAGNAMNRYPCMAGFGCPPRILPPRGPGGPHYKSKFSRSCATHHGLLWVTQDNIALHREYPQSIVFPSISRDAASWE